MDDTMRLLHELTEARTKLIHLIHKEGWNSENIRKLGDLQNAIAAVQAELSAKFGEQ
ncbi:hypothetical protein [Rhizobium tubonense]|uniref:hypothetical protein n=1 Tax=Rhizobium tubonense TaxID=484088 RepID=UPI0012B68E5B|nr:hypothetical protein [Rhizobium tubonense]